MAFRNNRPRVGQKGVSSILCMFIDAFPKLGRIERGVATYVVGSVHKKGLETVIPIHMLDVIFSLYDGQG